MDLAKYRALFVEDATEHLAEISRCLLELEKTPDHAASIDEIFRMAHSIKGMAASLSYDAITEVAHHLEDRMQAIRSAGRVPDAEAFTRLFHGLEALEAMVATVRDTGEPPASAPPLEEKASPDRSGETPKKKVSSR